MDLSPVPLYISFPSCLLFFCLSWRAALPLDAVIGAGVRAMFVAWWC